MSLFRLKSCAFVALIALASPALAQPTASDQSETLIREGLELRKQSQEQAALPYFQKAYALTHAPRAAAQLGFAEQALGLWVEADAHLAEARAAQNDAWIDEHRALLDESATFVAGHLGRLEVQTNAPTAEVLIDGKVAGRTPLQTPLRITTGVRRVELRAPTFLAASRTVEIAAGQTAHVVLTLSPVVPAAVATPVANQRADVAIAAERTPERKPLYRRWELWAGVAVAVAAGTVAAILVTRRPSDYPCGGGDRICAQ